MTQQNIDIRKTLDFGMERFTLVFCDSPSRGMEDFIIG